MSDPPLPGPQAGTVNPEAALSSQQLLQLAQQGAPEAIATLINRRVISQGLQVRASARRGHLYLRVRGTQGSLATSLVPLLQQSITNLNPAGFSQVTVLGEDGTTGLVNWSQTFAIDMAIDNGNDGNAIESGRGAMVDQLAVNPTNPVNVSSSRIAEVFNPLATPTITIPEAELASETDATPDHALLNAQLIETANERVRSFLQQYEQNQRDFKSIDLRLADLQGQRLSLANFSHANLSWTNLNQAKLGHSNLRQAVMLQTQLEGADLRSANLEGANLQGANLKGANLSWARLAGANLLDADLRGANLLEADLTRATLPDGTVLD